MSHAPEDPRWPRLLGLAVHEFRTPLTVVAGYIRMLLKDRAGAVTDQQRKLLEEAEKSCGRLSSLLVEMSDLANLEIDQAPFNRSAVALGPLLTDVVENLPPLPDREIAVRLSLADGQVTINADPVRLKTALTSILVALRRELVTSTELNVTERRGELEGRPAAWIAIGERPDEMIIDPAAGATFDEWRGGTGLTLAIARRILNAHGGAIWAPADGAKAAALVALPRA